VLTVIAVFTGRLLQVQALDSTALAAAALGNRLVPVTLPATRGTITDRNGHKLAVSEERRNITTDPTLFSPSKDYPHPRFTAAQAAAKLAPVLGTDAAAVQEVLTGNGKNHFAYLAKGVTPAVWHQVQALGIQGLYSERADERVYPAGSVAGNLIGFVGKDGTALAGLEYAENGILTGKEGKETYERGAQGQRIPMGEGTYTAPRNGDDLRLTVDEDLQYFAQQAIDAQVTSTGSQWGTVVVMTKTGQILTMAQSGAVDPNDPGSTPSQGLHNLALEDSIEPGSTGKVITASAAIQEGLVTPGTQLTVPGALPIPHTTPIHDAESHGDEKLTFAGVLAQSSNIGTVMVGRQLGSQKFYDYLRAFGVGSKQLGLPGETAGILAPGGKWDGRTKYTVLFGQGYGVNVVQQAQVYATIANGGVRVQPSIIAGTTGPDGVYHPAAPATSTRVVSEQTAKEVVSMLEGAVSADGTGANANVAGFRVAGKTGTADDLAAEAADPTGKKYYTSSFIGMAPADDPQLVVAVTLQHPQTNHFGGTVAAPVFSDVMSYALAQRHVAPSGTQPDLVPLTW
jgi:cell division protein FtsI (penicillin-binding protein 3)